MPRFQPLLVVSLAGALLVAPGCRGATDAFGTDAGAARTNATAFATALEQRFTRVIRTPKFLGARMRIGRYAFAPSKLVADTSLWTSMSTTKIGAERRLEVTGTLLGTLRDGYYTFSAQNRVAVPTVLGDSRHRIGLMALPAEDEWEWSTSVENVVGTMPPSRATAVMRALFASVERSPADVHADYRAAAPRTTAALGRMFTIDSLFTARQSDGSSQVELHLLMSDERLKPEFPELANYVRKYVAPATFELRLSDQRGAEWIHIHMARLKTVIRFHVLNGELLPLTGPARHMPDTLQLLANATAKLSFFTVGASNIVGEFVHVRKTDEQGWAMRFSKEPEWNLPLISERLLRSPLRRPFEGAGVQFRIGIGTGPAGQTLLSRSMSAVVKESAIMRFLGNLGFTAMSDYAGKVEEEENRFIAEWFAAMRADLAAY